MPGVDGMPVDGDRCATDDRDVTGGGAPERRPGRRHLECSRVDRVTDQPVGKTVGDRVGRTGRRDTKVGDAVSTPVLDQRE